MEDKADSASWEKVLSLPVILCFKLIPSMMVADGSGVISAGKTIFSSTLAKTVLFVVQRDPSSLASSQGTGPRGWTKTFLMRKSLLWATSTMWPNNFQSAIRVACLVSCWFCDFSSDVREGFQLLFFILSWNCIFGELASRWSCLKDWYASSPIL